MESINCVVEGAEWWLWWLQRMTMTRCHHFLLLHNMHLGLPCILQYCVYNCRIAGRRVHRKAIPITQAAYLKQCISAVGPTSCWEIQQWTWSALLGKCTVLLLQSFKHGPCALPGTMHSEGQLSNCAHLSSCCEKNEPEECKGGALPCIDCLDKYNQFQNCSCEFCLRSVSHARERAVPL